MSALLFRSSLAPAVLGSPAKSCPKPLINIGTPPKGKVEKSRTWASSIAFEKRVEVTKLSVGFSDLIF